jgi:hypothetical protein
MNRHLPVRPRKYGSALNEISALKSRVVELEQDKTDLLTVLDEARDAIQSLNRVLPDSQAVTQ